MCVFCPLPGPVRWCSVALFVIIAGFRRIIWLGDLSEAHFLAGRSLQAPAFRAVPTRHNNMPCPECLFMVFEKIQSALGFVPYRVQSVLLSFSFSF